MTITINKLAYMTDDEFEKFINTIEENWKQYYTELRKKVNETGNRGIGKDNDEPVFSVAVGIEDARYLSAMLAEYKSRACGFCYKSLHADHNHAACGAVA